MPRGTSNGSKEKQNRPSPAICSLSSANAHIYADARRHVLVSAFFREIHVPLETIQ